MLGLLTTSVKDGFDKAYNARGEYAAELAQMDRCLATMGPRRRPIRAQLKSYAAAVIASTWPDEPPPKGVNIPTRADMPVTGETPVLCDIVNAIGLETRSLQPKDSAPSDPAGRLHRAISQI